MSLLKIKLQPKILVEKLPMYLFLANNLATKTCPIKEIDNKNKPCKQSNGRLWS